MNAQEVLNRLEQEGVEHLWVIYHDYSGRACAKTVPQERFAGIFDRGVVFARANLDFNLEDHMAPGSVFYAETGDFLAVPDPTSYAPIPYYPATARMHAFMRADDGSAWEGCPRTRLQRLVDLYAARGLSVRASFEAEFMLFEPLGDGDTPDTPFGRECREYRRRPAARTA
jgi:glutamine synthetase